MQTPAKPQQSEFRRGWPVVLSAMLGVGLGLSPLPFYTIGVFAPYMAKAFAWSYASIFTGLIISSITVVLGSPIIGFLVQKFGVRPVALSSLALFGLAFMSFGLATGSLIQYYITWAVMAAAGIGTLPITWTKVVNGWFDRSRGLALGLSMFCTGLFGSLVKPFAATLIGLWNWRVAYFGIGVLPIVIALPIAYFLFREPEAGEGAPGAALVAAKPTPGGGVEAFADYRFWLIGLAFLPISFAIAGPIPNLETHLKLSGFDKGDVVQLASFLGLAVIFGRITGGWMLDRFWAPAVALVLLALPAAACWGLTLTPLSYGGALTCILMIGMAAGIEYDLLAYLVARYFGMGRYAVIYSLLYGSFALGSGLAPVIYGWLYDKNGNYRVALLASCILMMCGALALLGLGRYPAKSGAAITVETLPSAI
jgi:MFS family permease